MYLKFGGASCLFHSLLGQGLDAGHLRNFALGQIFEKLFSIFDLLLGFFHHRVRRRIHTRLQVGNERVVIVRRSFAADWLNALVYNVVEVAKPLAARFFRRVLVFSGLKAQIRNAKNIQYFPWKNF